VFAAASLSLSGTLAPQDAYSAKADHPAAIRPLDDERSTNDAAVAIIAAHARQGSTAAPTANALLGNKTYDQALIASARFAFFEQVLPPESALSKRIATALTGARVDDEAVDIAKAAAADASTIANRLALPGTARVMFSSDGLLTLQWRREDRGVALLFAGDKTASIAFKRPGQLYAENGLEVRIDEDMPAEFFDAIEAFVAA
jgi:hypothetical protein